MKVIEQAGLWAVPLIMTLLYLIFPNLHPSNDAWAYAADARLGVDLFSPHHLLYTASAYVVIRIFDFAEPILVLQGMNAFMAGLSLALMAWWLMRSGLRVSSIGAWVFTAGASFVLMRFATENEAYLMPMPFVLLSALFLQGALPAYRWMLAGLCMGLAILYHQQHLAAAAMIVVWGLWHKRNYAGVAVFIGMFLLPVILGYALVGVYLTGSGMYGWQYFFHDFHSGSAQFVPGMQQWLLTPISLVRAFFQVHGYMLPVLKGNILLALGTGFAFLTLIFVFTRIRSWWQCHQWSEHAVLPTYLFVAYLMFAIWFGANQEFMVPLPFLLFIIMAIWFQQIPQLNVWLLGISLLIWNLCNALIPQRFLILNAQSAIEDMILQDTSVVWILSDESAMRHRLRYTTGSEHFHLLHSPVYYTEMFGSTDSLQQTVASALSAGHCVRTDVLGAPALMSRKHILQAASQDFWLDEWAVVDSVLTDVGLYPVHLRCGLLQKSDSSGQ
jgi:hypothetical protein